MTTAHLATMPIHSQTTLPGGNARWLVQIFPLDLERGPIPLTSASTTLGRDSQCDVALEDPSVSRIHAVIRNEPQGFVIEDLASTNGVFVNDQAVRISPLSPGDRLRLGKRIFRFLDADDIESQYYETVYGMMTRDGLTGAYNKRYLTEALAREIARCRRYERPLCVAMLDVDRFKCVNDAYGHLVGDEVLCEVAWRLRETARDEEIIARFGGEEFAVVMVELEIAKAAEAADRYRRAIAEAPFETEGGLLDITISVGVAPLTLTSSSLADSADGLLEQADWRLYEAKRLGRNCVVSA